ncbi:KptA family-domain-containing protein [Aspergillus transmontanensis]|uniref:2'-phosphotransferase n=1 Tax=Aspergillus transmontanensis TaxID=1034304 RepID=A0A5N6VD81_9EURO|nr:KptA family-domain-containing protein [Aspergillus transmontanensis]
METAIRWSPSSTTAEQRFLSVDVVGKAFRLCKVTSFDGQNLEHEVLAAHTKVPAFRAFDWSPADESLVAVGQSSGDATILRLNSESQESFSFPIRHQRYCNAVAFSTHGLLAAGLDRVRNDFCLNVWDVNQRLAMRGGKGVVEPLRKLASSEPITSVKFFRDQPDTLVAGVKGQFVRIYDLREGPGNPSLQFPTRCVHALAIDWLDENYIASCLTSNDPTICIWDRRVGSRYTTPGVGPANTLETGQPGPALEFKDVIAPKSTIWSLRFSRTKRGCLGVLANTGHFKTYDVVKEYLSEEYRSSVDVTLGQGSSKNYPEQIYTKYVRDVSSPFNHPSRGYPESERIVSFDFLNMSPSNEPTALTLSGNGQVNIITTKPPSPPVRLSSQGLLIRGTSGDDADFRTISPLPSQGLRVSEVIEDLRERILPSHDIQEVSREIHPTKPLSSREARERALSLGASGNLVTAEEALTLLTINRLRCKEGYLFDAARNRRILADDPRLQGFWGWIERARNDSSNDSMIANGLDLNYVGVYDIWNNDLGETLDTRHLEPDARLDISKVIVNLVREQLNLPETRGCETNYPEHRRLCLRLCGAAQTHRELEELVKMLSADSQHTKAAALAVFQDEAKLAYLALRSHHPTQAHKLLAMAIAGAAKGDTDPDWEDTCAEIAKELTDPYARAILALVSKGDWNSVIQETTLPLKYRIEVAVRWLPDDELTEYINEMTAEAILQGDIEGIVLTGLGPSAMDLFQSYIRKFNDVQTPVLAMSHSVPRFINNNPNRARFEAWRETYRWQINSWKLQLERARFDVGSRKFAVTWDGRKLIEPPRQQVSLTCNYCTRPLTQHDASSQLSPSTTGEVVHPTPGNPLGTSAMSGMVCPRCGRHMPRCGVCTFWLGSPDPMSKACLAADAGQQAGKPTQAEMMRRFIVFCINCNHGFHAHHAQEWFMKHRIMGQQRRGKPSGGRDVTVSKALSLLLRHAAEKEGLKLDAQGYANVADVLAWRKLKSLKVTFPEIVAAVATSDKKRFALLHIPSAEAQAQQSTSAEASTDHGIPTTSAGQDSATETALAVSESDLDPAHFLIRATQGHSIKSVDAASLMEKLSLDEEAKLPDTVVHGTFHAAWPAILASGGLRSMGRNQVHFATGPSVESVLAQGAQGAKEVTGDHGEKVISGMRRDAQVLIYIDLKKALAAGCPFWRSENGVILSEGMVVEGSSGIVPVKFFDVVVERKHGLGKIWEGGKEIQAMPEELVKQGNPKGRRNANKKKEDTTQP